MSDNPTPWCCTGFAAFCPLCEDRTGVTVHCPGHPDTDANRETVRVAELHARFRHPDYEYRMTEGPRKQWDDADTPPRDDAGNPEPGWERNVDAGHLGWERFDYTEVSYWRRRKTDVTSTELNGAPAFITDWAIAPPPPPNITINGEDGNPLVTIHPNGELEYGPTYTPNGAARAFWEALTPSPAAELALLHEGEEPYTQEGVVPTPAQWIWKWNRATPARRIQVAENVIRAQQAEQHCMFADHASALEELRKARLIIDRVRAFCSPEQNTDALGFLRRSDDVLTILDQGEQP